MQQEKLALAVATACRHVSIFLLTFTLLMVNGCSVSNSTNPPNEKNMSILNVSTPRSCVITEMGKPVWSGEKNGEKVDIFAFQQGRSKGTSAGSRFLHASATILTVGLWEFVKTPIQIITDNPSMKAMDADIKVRVTYDENERVKMVNYIQGQ